MGQKYVPSVKDRKASERYDRRALKQSKYIKPVAKVQPRPTKEK